MKERFNIYTEIYGPYNTDHSWAWTGPRFVGQFTVGHWCNISDVEMLNLSKSTSKRMILKLTNLVLWKSLALILKLELLKLDQIMLKL